MAKRKISKQDVDQAYDIAKEAKKSALFSLRRARQLKDGADKLRKEYKDGQKPSKQPKEKVPAKAKPTRKETLPATPKKDTAKK